MDKTQEQEDCEHSDRDGYICLECGWSFYEDYLSEQYDRAKDKLKYGE